ncbi:MULTISPECIES: hypothetical protein [Pseudoalteromonas]|uniref:hypothetical protein n=1 Tax=Pseudoalteromonas TaxID=53246 RepID=UPI00030CD7B7|nr:MULTISPECIES: hypothetical protein [Pseudoalteromonas]MCF6146872.1 hypothetical protein [Pseudoalteromonas mariniglutinosa NCIMB 1770]TMN73325.1 hypothetical protein CWB85_04205 [Pseudoalteromonas sp. S1727]
MKSIIKLSVAALLVVGSTQVSANDGQLDITQTLTNNIAHYIESASNELQSKLKESVFSDSQKMLNGLLSLPNEQLVDSNAVEISPSPVVSNSASKVEG